MAEFNNMPYDYKLAEHIIEVRLKQYEGGIISKGEFIKFSALDILISEDIKRVLENIRKHSNQKGGV